MNTVYDHCHLCGRTLVDGKGITVWYSIGPRIICFECKKRYKKEFASLFKNEVEAYVNKFSDL